MRPRTRRGRAGEAAHGRSRAPLPHPESRRLERRGVVERAVDPPENPHSPLVPTPARAPEALKRRAPDARIFRLGKAQILAEPGGAAGWHISVSHPERFPYFEELMAACGVTGDADKRFAALIPAAKASSEGSGFLVHLVEAVAGGTEGSGA